ncbi:Uu.00g123230.m01.CDS01 [Anthostomella pinea]|uniref:Uu.00g123230.m01.CDS01 n=1 Tax=Anthostomella pinea TaxID=933095 RepID=A0AAI8VID3_9PEZI|nr:Uu.00g123230.m01.CDS01 [Anthostomella pinea]
MNLAEPGMQYSSCTANDGCTLAYQTSLPIASSHTATPAVTTNPRSDCLILLLHGFSGSSAYFKRNYAALSAQHWVVAPDMRGHGNSTRTRGGYHVARLAADLRDLVAHLRHSYDASAPSTLHSLTIVPVGCSIGAAVLWTYAELFGCADFAGFVFVDQAPLQDRSVFDGWDASRAHLGCYDEATTQAAQRTWIHDSDAAHRGLVQGCLGYRHAPESGDDVSTETRKRDEEFFVSISAQCDQEWLARLLSDHTRYDHREAIEEITVPTLVMGGRRTGCFPLEGMEETVKRVNGRRPELAKMSVFDSGHWLFYEEPDRFNSEIIEFVETCRSISI